MLVQVIGILGVILSIYVVWQLKLKFEKECYLFHVKYNLRLIIELTNLQLDTNSL